MRRIFWLGAFVTGLFAVSAHGGGGRMNLDAVRQLMNNPNLDQNYRRQLQSYVRQYDARRKQVEAQQKKQMEQQSYEAVKEAFEKGKKAYDEQRYSSAYLHFRSVAGCSIKKAAKMAAEAKTRVIEIEGMARAKVQRAEILIRRGEPVEAAQMLHEVAEGFPYSEWAKRASRRLSGLRNTPSVASTLRYLEGKDQEDAESYLAALAVYDEVMKRWPDEIAALRARKAARDIRRDPQKLELVQEELEVEAERVCPALLNLAKNYLINKNTHNAREKLKQVTSDYPGTTYAEEAKAMLEKLDASAKKAGPAAAAKP